jgi:hypothetical protein
MNQPGTGPRKSPEENPEQNPKEDPKEDPMSTLKLFGAALLAVAVATPALAQAVISEPGYCAFFYPTANCQNKGSGNPYTDPNFRRGQNAATWPGDAPVAAPKRPPRHRSSS